VKYQWCTAKYSELSSEPSSHFYQCTDIFPFGQSDATPLEVSNPKLRATIVTDFTADGHYTVGYTLDELEKAARWRGVTLAERKYVRTLVEVARRLTREF
jgi:hypothetical protein